MDSKQACHAWLQQHQQQQHFAERVLEHLAFNSDILDRWTHIGNAQGLSTDLEVATFLIQHYESTWDRAPPPAQFCVNCHSPLTLLCTKCLAINPPSSTTASTTTTTSSTNPHHNPHHHQHQQHHTSQSTSVSQHSQTLFPTLFPQSEDDPYSDLQGKGKKRKKTGGRKGEGGVDNDDELLGLYIQFGQGQSSGSGLQPGDGSFLPGGGKKGKKGGGGKKKRSGGEENGGGAGTNKSVKAHVCTHCGKTIFKLSDFKKHVRIHTREKPYKCPLCPAAFSDSSAAAKHRRVHTGEKPYPCPDCPAAFAQSSDLTKHRRVHTQERPWQCEVCSKTFSDSSQFAHHRRQHEKQAAKGGGSKGAVHDDDDEEESRGDGHDGGVIMS